MDTARPPAGRASAALLLACVLAWAGTVRAEDDPPPGPGAPEEALGGEALERQVERWIAQLRSDRFEEREAARAGLKAHGLKARAALERAADDPDPEVRRTIQALLEAAPRPGATTLARGGDFERLGLISVRYEGCAAREALADLGTRIGARFEVSPGLGETPVRVVRDEAPPFDVLHEILAQAGLWMPRGFADDGSVALEAGRPAEPPPRVAAGPIEVRLGEVSVARTLGVAPVRRYALTFEVRWIPLVRLQQYESLRLEVARDAEGRAWTSGLGARGTTTYGVGRGEMARQVTLALSPASEVGPERLAVLQVVLPLRLRHGVVSVQVDDVDALPQARDARGAPVAPGAAGSVVFQSLTQPRESPGQWVAELRARLAEGVEQDSLEPFALAADGAPVRMLVYGGRSRSADGTLHLTARSVGPGAQRPAALGARWLTREDQGTLRLRFEDIPLR